MNTSQNCLITGGCGFIGVNLIALLLKENPNISIKVLDNLSIGSKEKLLKFCGLASLPSNIELVIGDIRDYDACLKCCNLCGSNLI